jgi:GNAT superfamily N-acetyltransferase
MPTPVRSSVRSIDRSAGAGCCVAGRRRDGYRSPVAVTIEQGQDPAGVERILRALPAWFGIEESILGYVADAGRLPGYLARDGGVTVGIALVHRHYPESAELHLIAVDPERHRTGIGAALIAAVTADLAADGARLLQVHTVGPSWPDAGYQRTRAFYRRLGFLPLQEFDGLDWGGPTQILVAPIGAAPGGSMPDAPITDRERRQE